MSSPSLKDDVGRRDVDLTWGGQLLFDVRGVVRADDAGSYASIECFVTPVGGCQLVQRLGRQRVREDLRLERGRSEDMIPMRVRERDGARRRDPLGQEPVEDESRVGSGRSPVEHHGAAFADDRAQRRPIGRPRRKPVDVVADPV